MPEINRTPQPLFDNQVIVTPTGFPTQYFIRWCQERMDAIQGSVTPEQVIELITEFLTEHPLIEGTGISLTPSGDIGDDVTVALADTAVTPDTYGDATHVVQITVDQQGRITAAVEVPISGGGGGGGLVLLEQHTAINSASLDFTTAISATYDEYVIEFVNIIPANNNVSIYMRMSTNGGSSYDASGVYSYAVLGANRFVTGTVGVDSGATQILLDSSLLSNTGLAGACGSLKLFSPLSTTLHKNVTGQLGIITGPSQEIEVISGRYQSTTAVNAFQFRMSAGLIASGTIRVYGVAK